MSNNASMFILNEIVEAVREQGLRYSDDNDRVQAGDYSDEVKAHSRSALSGYQLAYMHLIDVAQNAVDNYPTLIALADVALGGDDSAYPGNYL